MASILTQLRNLLDADIDIDGKQEKVSEILMKALLVKALRGDLKALNMILEYVEGKPAQAVEISGKNGEGIEFNTAFAVSEIDAVLEDFTEQ